VTRALDARGKPKGCGQSRIKSKGAGFPLEARGNDELKAEAGFRLSPE